MNKKEKMMKDANEFKKAFKADLLKVTDKLADRPSDAKVMLDSLGDLFKNW